MVRCPRATGAGTHGQQRWERGAALCRPPDRRSPVAAAPLRRGTLSRLGFDSEQIDSVKAVALILAYGSLVMVETWLRRLPGPTTRRAYRRARIRWS
jgi:hypothetical protein